MIPTFPWNHIVYRNDQGILSAVYHSTYRDYRRDLLFAVTISISIPWSEGPSSVGAYDSNVPASVGSIGILQT